MYVQNMYTVMDIRDIYTYISIYVYAQPVIKLESYTVPEYVISCVTIGTCCNSEVF